MGQDLDAPLRHVPDARPAIAVISNAHTPYRLHLHRRIAAELPEVMLFSLYTHQTSNSDWTMSDAEAIGPVHFGASESCDDQDRPSRQASEWRKGGRIIRWLGDHDVRFVLMMGYNDLGRLRIMRWCRRHGTPCFLFGDSNVFGDRPGGAKAALKRLVLGRILNWCDGVLVCGRLGQRYFERYGVAPQRMFLFPYEPDYDLIRGVSPEAIAGVRSRFGLDPERQRIVYSGRLVPAKRVDLLVDAFVALAGDRPTWDLLIVGDGPLRESLQGRLPTGLAGRVIWTGFLDDQASVAALYRTCDVLVLPSDYEPWALVINEAVAAGLAVVSSDVVGAAAELVVDGANGRTFPPGDLAQLIDRLDEVTKPDVLARMKGAADAVLADWRHRGDPIAGLKSALRSARVI